MAIPAQVHLSPVFGLQHPLSASAHPSHCSWLLLCQTRSSTTKLHALWRSISFGNLTTLSFISILQALQIRLNSPSQLTFYSNAHNHLQTYYIIPESGLFQAEVIPSSILVHPVPSSILLHWKKKIRPGNIMAYWCSLLMFCCLFFFFLMAFTISLVDHTEHRCLSPRNLYYIIILFWFVLYMRFFPYQSMTIISINTEFHLSLYLLF